MRQQWLRSLALSLGALVIGQATFVKAEPPAPLIEPYPPVASPPKTVAAVSADSAPAPSLERPIPLNDERPVDRKIQPAGLFSNSGTNTFAFSPAGSYPVGRPMAAGPVSSSAPLPMPTPVPTTPQASDVPYTWRQPTTSSSAPMPQATMSAPLIPMPRSQPGTTFGMDAPLSGGTTFGTEVPMPGTVVTPGIVSSPGVVPTPGVVTTPGAVPAPGMMTSPGMVPTPGVVAGPMGAPLDGGCMGDACCTPGCCDPGCCAPGCCAPDCCMPGCCPPCCDGVCCDGCCGCWGNGCCFGNRWYGSAEYLLWFIRGQSLPPLLTTGPASPAPPGALGNPGTTVLFGNTGFNNNPYSGVRLRGGYWFGDGHGLGLDFGGFFLGGDSKNFMASSIGVPFLSRPFTTAVAFNGIPAGGQSIETVAAPGVAGNFSAVTTFFLFGAEANLRRNFCCGCNWFIDGFAGWRLLGLNESLSINERLATYQPVGTPPLPVGTTFSVNDKFSTSNLFNGAQIGAIGEYRFGRWSIEGRTSVGLGGTMQFANVSGSTTTAAPGIPSMTAPGGLLALPSNIGHHTRSMVSFVEEFGLNVGYQFTNHIRGFVGYNFLFWSNVIRPGQQIDTTVNPNQIPFLGGSNGGGPNRPAFTFNGTNFWVQGVQLGIDIRW